MAAQHLIGLAVMASGALIAIRMMRGQGVPSTPDFFGGPGALDTFRALDAAGLNQKPFFAGQPLTAGAAGAEAGAGATPAPDFFGDLFGFDLFGGGASPTYGSVPAFETTVTPGVSRDVDTIARTIWGEARGEGARGMRAVAAVIMNRVRDARYPSTPGAVATQARQFSVWNDGDPNREKALAVTTGDGRFREALQIARRALAGQLGDPTGGATHYFAGPAPYWAADGHVSARIGGHTFMTGVA